MNAHFAAVVSLLSVSLSINALAQGYPSPPPRPEAASFPSALSAEALKREEAFNMGPDAEPLKAGGKVDARTKANISIFGNIVNNMGSPLCGLVLANGQFMFSCSPNGSWSLTAPQDAQGRVTLFGFVDGHFPYSTTITGSGGRYDMTLNMASTQPPPPQPTNSTITFTITDGCNNGIQIRYKFYDFGNNLVWPSSTSHYFTEYYNASYTHNLSCRTGGSVCYGARSTGYWGVDVDGSKSCSDCCIACQNGNSLSRRLTC